MCRGRKGERRKRDALDKRREPTRESERLTPVTPEIARLGPLDEPEVEPRDEPAELDLFRAARDPIRVSVMKERGGKGKGRKRRTRIQGD